MACRITQTLQLKERLSSVSQKRFAKMNLIAAEYWIGMVAGINYQAVRFGETSRRLARDFLALQHGGEIQ